MNEVFEKEIEHITKRLETLEHTVYGNGHKGLKALIAILCAVMKIIF